MRYSIVIPTRERADTLASTLKSCLTLDYDDYEIVVCDNFSSPETAEVVNLLNSNKIVYYRADRPLSMGENWNLAYSLTSGDFILYIGDDDAIFPFALKALDFIIKKFGADVVRWTCGMYCWPDIVAEELKNYLAFCYDFKCQWSDGHQMLRNVLKFTENAAQLPNIYHGCVSRHVLERIREKSGHVFASYYCDTYSSVAIAYTAKRYMNLSAALTLSGFSKHSNNVAFSFVRGKHKNSRNYRAQNGASGVMVHPQVPDVPHPLIPLIDSFLTAKQELFPHDDEICLDREALVDLLLEDPAIDSIDEWELYVAEIRRSVEDDTRLLDLFYIKLEGLKPRTSPRPQIRQPLEGAFSHHVFLSADHYAVKTVFDAINLAQKIVNYSTWDFRDPRAFGERLRRKYALDRRKKLLIQMRSNDKNEN